MVDWKVEIIYEDLQFGQGWSPAPFFVRPKDPLGDTDRRGAFTQIPARGHAGIADQNAQFFGTECYLQAGIHPDLTSTIIAEKESLTTQGRGCPLLRRSTIVVLKIPAASLYPAASNLVEKSGRIPVAFKSPSTFPPSSIPACSNLNISLKP